MKVYNSVTEMVGNTPILKLNKIIAKENLSFHLFGKIVRQTAQCASSPFSSVSVVM